MNNLNFFNKIYCINIPTQNDRLNNIINTMNVLNVDDYVMVTPIDKSTLINYPEDYRSLMSATVAHIECIKDAQINNYTNIVIFEDDATFNQSNNDILDNLDLHINNCINFISNNDYDFFFFDNIKFQHIIDNKFIQDPTRFESDEYILNVLGNKPYLHSYAINCNVFQNILDLYSTLKMNDIVSINRKIQMERRKSYVYVPGIFDQNKYLSSTK